MNHIVEHRRGDDQEPHLVNALARITFAVWQAYDMGQLEATYVNESLRTDIRDCRFSSGTEAFPKWKMPKVRTESDEESVLS